jgi:hypothetical protein
MWAVRIAAIVGIVAVCEGLLACIGAGSI